MSALLVGAVLCYGLAAGTALVSLAGWVRAPRRLALITTALGALCHLAATAVWTQRLGTLPLSGLAPALSTLALLVAFLQFMSELSLGASAATPVTGPLTVMLLGTSLALGPVDSAPSPSGDAWFILHVGLSFLGVALLAIAFAAAALYVIEFRELKARHFGPVFQLLPPLERLDRLNQVALVGGFAALTLGLALAGAHELAVGGRPIALPQLVWGTLTWLVLGWAVWGRTARGWSGIRAAYVSIGGFTAVVLVYVALKFAAPTAARFL
jgi:ABC-type uncharacterized transport system permease subunit